ncbi:Uncharacterised protein [Shigella sonnei]|nr:Uncharacterised protein [Shigella sonnei]
MRVGIGRTGLRKLANQFAVADSGKQHARQRQQIGRRNVTVANAGDNTKSIKYGHRREIGQTHHYHLPQFQ